MAYNPTIMSQMPIYRQQPVPMNEMASVYDNASRRHEKAQTIRTILTLVGAGAAIGVGGHYLAEAADSLQGGMESVGSGLDAASEGMTNLSGSMEASTEQLQGIVEDLQENPLQVEMTPTF